MRKILMWTVVCLITGAAFMSGVLNAAANEAEQGKQIYENRCAVCHGAQGAGNGPAAASFTPGPRDFTKAAFWNRKDIDSIISRTVHNGRGAMPPLPLSDEQISEVIAYMSQNFKPSGN